ncbi:MAG: class I SAM-dependent DNA methyltransferase, partial [Aggregatilineales bacterium]
QWTNTSAEPFIFHNADLLQPRKLDYILWLLTDPNEFLEERKRELGERAAITEQLAKDFAKLADQMRAYQHNGQPVWSSLQIARFLTKLVFSLFAEDIGLLPRLDDQPVFRYLVEQARRHPKDFAPTLHDLFAAMNGERGTFAMKEIPYFNGGLFAESREGAHDGTEVLDLTDEAITAGALETLEKVANADWRKVNPTIFGTLFEAALDKSKRAQLGAHYTSEDDIRLIVEPVLMAPLQREWATLQAQAEPLMQLVTASETAPRDRQSVRDQLVAQRDSFLDRLAAVRVLDPACGSGNFLYVSLKALKDLESHVHTYFAPLGLPFRDVVTPRQLFGIEKDEFAAKLAHVVVWIGYLQWRYEAAGALIPVVGVPTTPRAISVPILNDKTETGGSRILNDDAILRYDATGKPYEPEWPDAEVIMGNPPFLGGNRIRAELKDKHVDELFDLYRGRVPAFADLVCYWFEKARAKIENGQAKRAGLLATNSIRGGANRTVLERIKTTGDIFMAWSDRPWLLDGAAVRVSMVGFDDGSQQNKKLDDQEVFAVFADLTDKVDLTIAKVLSENRSVCFRSDEKGGPFDIDEKLAQEMLNATNPNGKSNAEVIRPYVNGLDVTRRSQKMWVIDFGSDASENEAAQYEQPYEYVKRVVKPMRDKVNIERHRVFWWLHRLPAPTMRNAVAPLSRFIATPSVAKHRLFVWLERGAIPDHQLYVFARSDDYFFGVLHSYLHELWSLRMGTSLEDRPRYTPTTTFETFPFPYPPGHEPADDPKVQAIAAAAKALHETRDAWLNPPETLSPALLRKRTLTNLYNAIEKYRTSRAEGKAYLTGDSDPASKVAESIAALHDRLDAAVLAAYGWSDLADKLRTPTGDEELLRRLLALNLVRAEGTSLPSY